MTGAELAFWMIENGYGRGDLARLLGVDLQTVSRWRTGKEAIPHRVELALQTLAS